MKRDSVPRKKVVRYSLEGLVVGHTHKWALNSCSSSSELDARYVQPHQKTIERKKSTPKACNLSLKCNGPTWAVALSL